MRIVVAGILVIASAGAAAAAECAASPGLPDTVVAPDNGSATVFPDGFSVSGGSADTCTVTNLAVPIPAGHYGVYKVDGRGFTAQNAGEKTTYTVTYGSDTQDATIDGEYVGDTVFTHYFGTGLGPVSDFDAEFGLEVDGDGASSSELDSIDILAGYTTLDEQYASLGQLSTARTGIITALNTTTGLILGANQRADRPSEFGALGAYGSYTVGGYGHFDLGEGFTADLGAAAFDQSVGDGAASGVLLGGQARYIQPDNGAGMRWLGSAGASFSPDMAMTFSRNYPDGSTEGTSASGSTSGSMVGIWLEGGVLIAPTPTDELIFSASLGRNWLNTDAYSETLGEDNLFALSTDSATSTYDTIKAKAAWTTEISPEFDLTLHGAVGYISANDSLTGDVAFVDTLTVGGQSEAFVEYGARVGWSFAQDARWDVYALGSTGAESGTHFQVGTAASMKF